VYGRAFVHSDRDADGLFSVNGMALTGAVYKPALNHDPDGNSNGYSITVKRF